VATFRKRRDGYQVRWRDPDGKARGRQVATLSAARELVRAVQRCEDLGQVWTPTVSRAVPPLADAAERYLRERARVLAPSSLRAEALSLALLEEWLLERGQVGIDCLSRGLLGEWYDDLRVTGMRGSRTIATARKSIDRAHRFWTWLYDDDDLAEFVERPRALHLPRDRGGMPTVAPTWAEMDACIHAAGDDWQARALMVMRYTGLRIAQAMDLRWDDLDLVTGRMVVRGGKSALEARGRVVPLAPGFVALLAGWGLRSGYVVEAPEFKRDGHGRLRPRVFRSRDAARYWRRAGVREECWRGQPDHAMRKGFVSGLKRLGADDEAVEYLVGHARGLRGVYVDPEALPLRAAVDLVPEVCGPLVAHLPSRKSRRRAQR